MNFCIRCGSSPLFILSFTNDYLNRFCKNCILDFANELELCGTSVINCYYCYNFDYEFNFKTCLECNINFCFNCRSFHIASHYQSCNDKFKEDLTQILENFICKDVVHNILIDYVEL